ncbi:LPS export ABC transporter periplasmic protein LptC [Campylobacter canadensis]|uniref:LPS export ABC transporter periplasmic protein LptC n=2 Tax=Campylobacter canadensis TaxID=449520 RepID=A0ABS7WP82_9BACT|nr:LPS export ABC transporter periplasmic protein LptC [Campylobacter canadensis]MBZ7986581.1 LPS export ABC transporter periplasmic protein LptC [Campylobacter canadensis]MBZ7994014.1 LPS export ABC transporter periplasmic protein LptC [Campylobacter canadensis]MBZ7999345.1 LPS export ABC transporter periplasmic protein LptC [Campylobacter canadensis]MBZ8001142.1 LPS export ABC transporter periplasmic protein LptC [Campylobacter canadensis]MBZ8003671.1 LPS export ABC transporter periplasmic p
MLVKLFNAILLSLCAMLFFIFIQEPYVINTNLNQIDFRSIDTNNVQSYAINQEILQYNLKADKYFKEGNKDVFVNAFLQDLNSNLQADIAYKENNIFYLQDNVKYKNDALLIKSNVVEYDLKDKIITSNSDTKLEYKNYYLTSKNAVYNLTSEDLTLKGVYLCIN